MRNIWQQYTDVLHSKGIRRPCDRWYVVRAEAFLRAHQGTPLKEYTGDLVKSYLAELGRNQSLKAWQFIQAVDAVRLLCTDVSTTMIYTHVLNTPGLSVRSPVDSL